MYAQSVERDTGFALGVMSLGYAYSTLGEQEKAVEYMQRYIRMAPDQPDPRASYADILVRAGRYDEALEQYRAALAIKADYWYAVREIGTVYLIKGRLHDAERQFEEAVRMLPPSMATEAGMLRLRGVLDIQRGHYGDAVALFRAAGAIDSSFINQAYPMALSPEQARTIRRSTRGHRQHLCGDRAAGADGDAVHGGVSSDACTGVHRRGETGYCEGGVHGGAGELPPH